MRLTNMSDYAVRLLVYLSDHRDRLCTIAEIASAYGLSEPHLMKITHKLARHGWIRTFRGKNGGMELAHEPADIRLGELIADMENDFMLVECMGPNNQCALYGRCGLNSIVQGALDAFMRHLNQYTLADAAKPGTNLLPNTIVQARPMAAVAAERNIKGNRKVLDNRIAD